MHPPYKTEFLLQLLDPPTIHVLNKIYGVTLRQMAARLNVTGPAVFYLLKQNRLKDWHKETLLHLYIDHGADHTFILLIHTMTNQRRSASRETD